MDVTAHGSQCWGIHTSAELELFRQREGLETSAVQRSSQCNLSGAVAVCREVLLGEVRRWCEGSALAVPEDEFFFDAPVIPRRSSHRRRRKRQRATHRKQRRQQRRRDKWLKSKWLGILARGSKEQRERKQSGSVQQQPPAALVEQQSQPQQSAMTDVYPSYIEVQYMEEVEVNRVLQETLRVLEQQLQELERELAAAGSQEQVQENRELADRNRQLSAQVNEQEYRNDWLEDENNKWLEQQEREHAAEVADALAKQVELERSVDSLKLQLNAAQHQQQQQQLRMGNQLEEMEKELAKTRPLAKQAEIIWKQDEGAMDLAAEFVELEQERDEFLDDLEYTLQKLKQAEDKLNDSELEKADALYFQRQGLEEEHSDVWREQQLEMGELRDQVGRLQEQLIGTDLKEIRDREAAEAAQHRAHAEQARYELHQRVSEWNRQKKY